MFAGPVQRFGGIEDIFKGVTTFAMTAALPLYTQYQSLMLLKRQAEAQKQIAAIVATPLPRIVTQPSPITGFYSAVSANPLIMLALGGGVLFGGYLLLTGGKRKN